MNKSDKITDEEAWEYVVEQEKLIKWALFKTLPKHWTMFAGEGESSDVVQECRINAHKSVKRIGCCTTAIVNATKWTLFELIRVEKNRLKGLESYSSSHEARQVSYDNHEHAEDYRQHILSVLKSLNYREREIINMRFGFGDGSFYTLNQVARVFSVTRERIRQLEGKAIRKLQHPTRANNLRYLLEGMTCDLNLDKYFDSNHSCYFLERAGILIPEKDKSGHIPAAVPPDPLVLSYRNKKYRVIWSNMNVPEDKKTSIFRLAIDRIRDLNDPLPWLQDISLQ